MKMRQIRNRNRCDSKLMKCYVRIHSQASRLVREEQSHKFNLNASSGAFAVRPTLQEGLTEFVEKMIEQRKQAKAKYETWVKKMGSRLVHTAVTKARKFHQEQALKKKHVYQAKKKVS